MREHEAESPYRSLVILFSDVYTIRLCFCFGFSRKNFLLILFWLFLVGPATLPKKKEATFWWGGSRPPSSKSREEDGCKSRFHSKFTLGKLTVRRFYTSIILPALVAPNFQRNLIILANFLLDFNPDLSYIAYALKDWIKIIKLKYYKTSI